MRWRRFVMGGLVAVWVGGGASARLVEEQIMVPVEVARADGRLLRHRIVVTVFHESTAPRPYPVLVLNHGRSFKAEQNAALGRVRFSAVARWLTGFGFIVAVPTRVGYGASGGEDVENSGPCHRKNYRPVYLAAARQTLAVIDAVRRRPDAAADRAVVMGQSFGGTTAITVASLQPPGLQAAVNFAGGGGGNPETRPQNPCSADALRRLFADYGTTARIPTLWIYTENDMYMGPTLPREWFDAFRAQGGVGEFVSFPPVGDDGHRLFSRAPELWQPRVTQFLQRLGYTWVLK